MRTTSSAPRDYTPLLMLPSLVVLIFLFLVPLVLFFVRTFTEFDGSTAEFIEQARDLLLSQAYLRGLDFNAVLDILKDADRELKHGRQKEAS